MVELVEKVVLMDLEDLCLIVEKVMVDVVVEQVLVVGQVEVVAEVVLPM